MLLREAGEGPADSSGFEPKAVLDILEQYRIELVPAVPAMLAALNRELRGPPRDLSFIRAVLTGASASGSVSGTAAGPAGGYTVQFFASPSAAGAQGPVFIGSLAVSLPGDSPFTFATAMPCSLLSPRRRYDSADRLRGTSRNGMSRSIARSRGMDSTRSATTLRAISVVPPPMLPPWRIK